MITYDVLRKTKEGKNMTKKEEIYNYIKSYIAEHGYAPSYREIGTAVNLKSTSSVYAHMQGLFAEGILRTEAEEGTPKAFRIAEKKETDPILRCLLQLKYEYFSTGNFVVNGREITLDQMVEEVRNKTAIGEKFTIEVYKNIVTYMMKFGGDEE